MRDNHHPDDCEADEGEKDGKK